MDLFRDILVRILGDERVQISFPEIKISTAELVEMASYNALKKIKAIIVDDSLSDAECFNKIEEIVCVFEEIGSSGGARHDY